MTITVNADRDVMQQSLSAFLRALEGQNRSTATLAAYRTDLMQFFTYLKANSLIANSPERVVRADIEEFLTWCARHGISGTSRARKLAAVRMFFRYLAAHDLIVRSPAEGIATPRKERHTRTFYLPHEYHAILSLAGSYPRDYAIFEVFLQTGIRVSELCALQLDDVDLPGHTLHVKAGKGGKARTIELEKKGRQAIKNYLRLRTASSYTQLFLNRYGEPLSERGVRKIVTKYRERAHIAKKVSCHGWRHTFATQKAAKGVSPYQLQAWLGHESLATTQIYVHLGRQDAQRVMDQTSLSVRDRNSTLLRYNHRRDSPPSP
jgi:site-specific recombinase XerD